MCGINWMVLSALAMCQPRANCQQRKTPAFTAQKSSGGYRPGQCTISLSVMTEACTQSQGTQENQRAVLFVCVRERDQRRLHGETLVLCVEE